VTLLIFIMKVYSVLCTRQTWTYVLINTFMIETYVVPINCMSLNPNHEKVNLIVD
jgi:hypothetical protein